jgi:hypothetical protein|tara:strand:- start:607 stop:777 length:171 start_codon:yes stop_codon:yes gene_type:complete
MSESETFVILIEFEGGRRDVSDLIFQNRDSAELHGQKLEESLEVLWTTIRRTSLVK